MKKLKQPKKKPFGILILIFFVLFGLYLMILFPSLIGSQKIGNEVNAVSRLRSFYNAQQEYFEKTKKFCGTLDELSKINLINKKLVSGQESGYNFILTQTENICSFTASPISSSDGTRSIFISNIDNGKIHVSTDKTQIADKNSPILNN